LRRIRGLFVITRALLPFLVVLALLITTWLTTKAVVDASERYGERLGAQLDGIQTAVGEANEGLTAIGGFVTSTVGAADALLDRVADLRSEVAIALPSVVIPEFTVLDRVIDLPDFILGDGQLLIPVPGVEALQAMASDLVDAGLRVADPVVKIAALADVPPQLEQAGRDTAEYAGDVRSVMGGWFAVVAFILILGALVWLIAAATPVTDELGRGWSLLRGRPASGRVATDLLSRVAELERRLGTAA